MTSTSLHPVHVHTWDWNGYSIRYQQAGTSGAAIVLIHGFGASSDHWRKTIPVLAETNRVYAIDLLGFGLSEKPSPSHTVQYTFDTWGDQVAAFVQTVVGQPAFLVGNSIGCIVALQTAVIAPDRIQGVVMINCSLRLLHDRKRATLPWYRRWSAPVMQKVLTNRAIGHYFFSQLAKPKVIRNILLQAYARADAVTDELVDFLYQPALDTGAADVFLAFTGYSQGPLAEDLLPQMQCPVLVLWGEDDPWEPIDLGRAFAEFPVVEEFIALPNAGHCPQDEAPELVNPILQRWINRVAGDRVRDE
ncbi:MAG: alpha/beta fold hydrolase [Leptolyngbyaceae cyanobacterium SL_7_1]|nr:alpha/beta fold hydrolase [Leptolyngbyaceae cyanobacterium SL_7_1]